MGAGWNLERVPEDFCEDANTTWLDGISADRRSAFVMDSRGRNTAALTEVDLATRESRVLAEDPEADIVSAAYDPNSDRPYAAVSIAARQRWHLIDPAYAFDLDHLRAAQGGGEIAINSQSSEGGRIVAFYYRSDAAGEFRLYDRSKQTLKPLFKSRTDLDSVALRPMSRWSFRQATGPIAGLSDASHRRHQERPFGPGDPRWSLRAGRLGLFGHASMACQPWLQRA